MASDKRVIGSLKIAVLWGLILCSPLLMADLWITPTPTSGGHGDAATSAEKVLTIRRGRFPDGLGEPTAKGAASETQAFLVDPEAQVTEAAVAGERIRFRAPLKGQHWVYLLQRRLDGETLEIELTKYRFYNRQGDVQASLLKEIRGRTNDSKYGRPPMAKVPFEIVLQKPEQDHHISCCLYSGDRVRLKFYLDQQGLTGTPAGIRSESGWQARFEPDDDGVVRFEIPRYRYSDSSERHGNKHYLLITAEKTVAAEGTFQGQPYRRIHYRTSQPIDYRPSPLEWAAKLPAFLLLGGVILVTGFGIFLYRLRVRRRRLDCA